MQKHPAIISALKWDIDHNSISTNYDIIWNKKIKINIVLMGIKSNVAVWSCRLLNWSDGLVGGR